ncbi:MAG: ABC transporter substrate-binding protein [Deltaproteobacteria bacterium]|nr:ABC transporter substrate-binding protein [Deltaproteobacteria bacterium]
MPEETLGIKLYLKEINAKGGVHGRKFKFIEYDDQNKKKLKKENLIKLIEQDKIFAIHFTGGTPTALMVMKYAMDKKIPFTFPHQGSDALAGKKYIFTSYPFYSKETDIMMKFLVTTRKFTRIGLIYADNAYGKIFLNGVKRNCEKYGIEMTGAEPLKERDPKDTSGPMSRLKANNTQALIMALYVKQAAAVLRARKQIGWDGVTLVSIRKLKNSFSTLMVKS